jgi:predicted house-cleaning noncanonical NTP pyrophosphatase (MazG superfamily)
LLKEIVKLCGKNKVTHLFKDFEVKNDEFEKLHKEMNSYVQYKFKKARKNLIFNRLEMISKMSLLGAPQNIVCVLERIKIQK